MTLTPVAEHLVLELSLTVFMTRVCCDRGSNPHGPRDRPNPSVAYIHYPKLTLDLKVKSLCPISTFCLL